MIDLKQLKAAAVAAGGTAWKWWDSNSFRRLTFEKGQHTRDGDALSGCIQSSDGHPDVQMAPGVREFIELASPSAIIEIVERIESTTSNRSCPHEECAEPDRCPQAAACVDSWGYVNTLATASIAPLDDQAAEIARLRGALLGMLHLDEENHQRYSGDEDVCLEVRAARAALAQEQL